MSKQVRADYTLEFKQEAVRLAQSAESVAAAARSLGIADQTLHNWVRADRAGKLTATAAKRVSAEQMEIARLRKELAEARMERDILKKAAAYFAKESR